MYNFKLYEKSLYILNDNSTDFENIFLENFLIKWCKANFICYLNYPDSLKDNISKKTNKKLFNYITKNQKILKIQEIKQNLLFFNAKLLIIEISSYKRLNLKLIKLLKKLAQQLKICIILKCEFYGLIDYQYLKYIDTIWHITNNITKNYMLNIPKSLEGFIGTIIMENQNHNLKIKDEISLQENCFEKTISLKTFKKNTYLTSSNSNFWKELENHYKIKELENENKILETTINTNTKKISKIHESDNWTNIDTIFKNDEKSNKYRCENAILENKIDNNNSKIRKLHNDKNSDW